jgi:Carboxypeptidase regulatory-like domain
MHPGIRVIAVFTIAAVSANSIFANPDDGVVIKGNVKGDDGKAADGAEIRVKALDRKAPDKVTLTDSRGQYIVLGLVPGNYSITAFDPDGSARSRAIVKCDRKGWARVNFDLALANGVGDGATRMKQVIVISGHAFGQAR